MTSNTARGILGLIPEPPFEPHSWSGSSAPFFNVLRRAGVLQGAQQVRTFEIIEKARAFTLPIERWRARYHASIPRFHALTRAAARVISRERPERVLQIGAWFASGQVTERPCYSYHDGNAAEWYRHYDRGLLSEGERNRHLEWERSVYKGMTRLFVMSNWLADSFVRDFGVPRAKVCVVGAGINMPFPPVVDRDFSRPQLLFVGRDFERKGGRFLLEAFAEVRRQVDAHLTIVGPPAKRHVEGVRWEGYLSKATAAGAERLAQLFRASTCLVLPSIYEPFGISLCEGMAWGLPCVTVDRCAMPEIVLDSQTGAVAQPENSRDLARAILEVCSDPARAKAYGEAGRIQAERDFTWDAVARKIVAAL